AKNSAITAIIHQVCEFIQRFIEKFSGTANLLSGFSNQGYAKGSIYTSTFPGQPSPSPHTRSSSKLYFFKVGTPVCITCLATSATSDSKQPPEIIPVIFSSSSTTIFAPSRR